MTHLNLFLTKNVQDLYTKKYKTLQEQKTYINGKISHIHGLENLNYHDVSSSQIDL